MSFIATAGPPLSRPLNLQPRSSVAGLLAFRLALPAGVVLSQEAALELAWPRTRILTFADTISGKQRVTSVTEWYRITERRKAGGTSG